MAGSNGIWVHGYNVADIDYDVLQSMKISDIYLLIANTLTNGSLEWQVTTKQLATCLQQAHTRGIKVHHWTYCWEVTPIDLSNSSTRTACINAIISLVTTAYGGQYVDGVNEDIIEGFSGTWANYVTFFNALASALTTNNKVKSIAVPAWQGYPVETYFPDLSNADYLCGMFYGELKWTQTDFNQTLERALDYSPVPLRIGMYFDSRVGGATSAQQLQYVANTLTSYDLWEHENLGGFILYCGDQDGLDYIDWASWNSWAPKDTDYSGGVVPPQPTGTWGKTAVGASTDVGNKTWIHARKITASENGTIKSVVAWMGGGASGRHAQVAIYSHNSGTGKPQTKLVESAGLTIAGEGWATFPVQDTLVSSGDVIWLAFTVDADELTQKYDTSTSIISCSYNGGSGTYYDNMPTSYPDGDLSYGDFSIYVNYTTPAALSYVFDHYIVNGVTITDRTSDLIVNIDGTSEIGENVFSGNLSIQAVYTVEGSGTAITLTITSVAHLSTDPVEGVAHNYISGDHVIINVTVDAGYEVLSMLTEVGANQTVMPMYLAAGTTPFGIYLSTDNNVTITFYPTNVIAATVGYQIVVYNSTTETWSAINATLQEGIEERNGPEEYRFTVPNTTTNRALLKLNYGDLTSIPVQIRYKGVTLYSGVCSAATITPDTLNCLVTNPVYNTFKQATTMINGVLNQYLWDALNQLIALANLTDVVYAGGTGVTGDPYVNIEFTETNAYDALRELAESTGKDMYGTGFASGNLAIYVGTLPATQRKEYSYNTASYDARLTGESSNTLDKAAYYGRVTIRGTDISTGETIVGTAGSSGAAKVYVYTKPTTTATLNTLAARKLLRLNNPCQGTRLSFLTDKVALWKPGNYLLINRADLALPAYPTGPVEGYIIQRITHNSDGSSTVEVDVAADDNERYLEEWSSTTQDIALQQA